MVYMPTLTRWFRHDNAPHHGARKGNEKMKVFCDGRDRDVHEALKIITPEWVESGESCHQTVIDLADVCRELLGDIPDVGEGWRLCSHKVAESYWDGEQWRDLGQYQVASDWYRRKN